MMKKLRLEFGDAGIDISQSLSALVHIGDSIYAAGDEGVDLIRLQTNKSGTRFTFAQLIPLNEWFDLPIPPSNNKADGKKNKVVEIDLEGMDFDRKNRLLWMVGSHSLKRGRALPELPTDQNKERLTAVDSDANRFFLGYVKLKQDKNKNLRFPDKPKDHDKKDKKGKKYSAQLECNATSSELLDEISRDPLFARFCLRRDGVPGKDNGVDIEGLACGPKDRVLVGMRGPVLRGIAVILELAPKRISRSSQANADRLQLTKIGPDGLKYRRHFLDLTGHGIRDLCWHGDDLLILAGPTTGLDSPPLIFRWKKAIKALGKNSSDEEKFVWRAKDSLVFEPINQRWVQFEPGTDHAEAIMLIGKKNLLVGYDSPGTRRFKKPATVIADVIALK